MLIKLFFFYSDRINTTTHNCLVEIVKKYHSTTLQNDVQFKNVTPYLESD